MRFLALISALAFFYGNSCFAQIDSVNVTLLYGWPATEVKEVNLGNIKVNQAIECGCALHNKGTSTLIISDVKTSYPSFKIGPSVSTIKPQHKIGFVGKLKVNKTGDFLIPVEIYYKGVKRPTIVNFKGKATK